MGVDYADVEWLLSLDIGTRSMGWAAGRVDAAIPHCGTWELPGMADQGALYGRLWEKLGQWCERRRPDLIAYVRPFMNKGSIAAEGLGGLSSVLHLFCTGKATRLGAIPLRRIDEADARAAILDPNIRKLMAQASRAAGKGKGAGSKLAKAMAMEWCRARRARAQQRRRGRRHDRLGIHPRTGAGTTAGGSMVDPQQIVDEGYQQDDEPDVGTCRQCGAERPRNVVILTRRCATAGTGWGCVICCLPFDGAGTILCDSCIARWQNNARMIWWAVDGLPAENRRIRIRCLPAGTFDHNAAAHAMAGGFLLGAEQNGPTVI